ncbi:MAG: trehalose-phosphatase, partial [Candidatus Omnitrophica bacterium]|nr:trehalose-phosphatase [Candidatus Omnitrophota bacterium]
MKHLFSDWDKLRSKIDNSPRVFLLFDYDGTLSPIAPSPSEAKFPSTVKGLIRRLRRNSKFALAIISGRSMKDIKKMVGLKGITYIGNHGLEIEGRNTEFLGPRFHAFIKKIESALYREVKHTKGAKIEHKGVTLSLHYRLVKNRDKALIKRKFYRIVRPFVYSGKVRISSGKQVLEVRPNIEWDKGSAVTWLLKRKRGQILPLY